MTEFLVDLQGLSTETETLNQLTRELDTIAAYLDTPRRLQPDILVLQRNECSIDSPCGRCEGDCDTNEDCQGDLQCFERTGIEPVPGCEGNGKGGQDYCFDPDTLSDQNQQEVSSLSIEQQVDDLSGQMNASLKELEYQKGLLGSSNNRMTELNVLLRTSVLDTVNQNKDLIGQNNNLQGSVADLSGRVDQLQVLIGGLEAEVSGLEDALDDYENLNEQLEESIVELNRQNSVLENSNVQYATLNAQLNESLSRLEGENEFLAEQNEIFAALNTDLSATAEDLSGQVNDLERNVDGLEKENDRLNTYVKSLNVEIYKLSDLNDNLAETVQEMNSEVDRLTIENDRLEVLTTDLGSVASFLNETAIAANEPLETVAEFISDQISDYQSVVIETLQNTYIQRVSMWDCSFRHTFNNEGFINNGAVPIPEAIYREVINYIDDRILSFLCLQAADFEQYIKSRFNEDPTTMIHLVSAVEGYTSAALDYYFPDEGEFGLTTEDWANAGYACENLREDQVFFYSISNI